MMVSIWPWKRDDSSPASFEKALSKLSEQINRSTVRLDICRTRSRRIKALWTLYTSMTYLVYTLILALVLGIKQWNVAHYSGILGAPVVIYAVRKGVTAFYDWRISSEEVYLEDLQKQRDRTIEKLKTATKYTSTQQLLDKYGGSSAKSTPLGKGQGGTAQKRKATSTPSQKQQQSPAARTGIAPPPTANIPGRRLSQNQQPATPVRPQSSASSRANRAQSPQNMPYSPDEPSFAPNAFPSTSQSYPSSSHAPPQSPHWYDRILDVLLGEDETLPKNRLALICSSCRLVNGQAPPGVKSADDVGKWRCSGCGAWNGEESEAKKMLEAMKRKEENDTREGWEVVSKGDDEKEDDTSPVAKAPRSLTKTEIPTSEDEGEEDEFEDSIAPAREVDNDDDEDDTQADDPTGKRVTRSASKKNDLAEP